MTLDTVVQPDQYISPRGDVVDLKKSTQKPSFGKKMSRFLAPVMAAAALYAAPQKAKADLMWDWSASTPSQINGQATILNDNDGAIYHSYTLMLSDAMNALYNANPAFQSTYGSVQNMANALFSVSIAPDNALGEVNLGWNPEPFDVDGNLTFYNNSLDPGPDYDLWEANQQNPAQDTMLVEIIGNTPGYQFQNNPNRQVPGGQGFNSVGSGYRPDFIDQIQVRTVVPEPTTGILLLGGVGIALATRYPGVEITAAVSNSYPVIFENCTDLLKQEWIPFATNNLVDRLDNPSQATVTDTNMSEMKFYRATQQEE